MNNTKYINKKNETLLTDPLFGPYLQDMIDREPRALKAFYEQHDLGSMIPGAEALIYQKEQPWLWERAAYIAKVSLKKRNENWDTMKYALLAMKHYEELSDEMKAKQRDYLDTVFTGAIYAGKGYTWKDAEHKEKAARLIAELQKGVA